MIKIIINREDDDTIKSISSTGHSGYAEEGSDIVCASVSVLLQNAQKTFEEILNIETFFTLDENKPSNSLKSVLLPEPELPVTQTILPLGILNELFSITGFLP